MADNIYVRVAKRKLTCSRCKGLIPKDSLFIPRYRKGAIHTRCYNGSGTVEITMDLPEEYQDAALALAHELSERNLKRSRQSRSNAAHSDSDSQSDGSDSDQQYFDDEPASAACGEDTPSTFCVQEDDEDVFKDDDRATKLTVRTRSHTRAKAREEDTALLPATSTKKYNTRYQGKAKLKQQKKRKRSNDDDSSQSESESESDIEEEEEEEEEAADDDFYVTDPFPAELFHQLRTVRRSCKYMFTNTQEAEQQQGQQAEQEQQEQHEQELQEDKRIASTTMQATSVTRRSHQRSCASGNGLAGSLTLLPDEILIEIAKCLPGEDLARFSMVNTATYNIIESTNTVIDVKSLQNSANNTTSCSSTSAGGALWENIYRKCYGKAHINQAVFNQLYQDLKWQKLQQDKGPTTTTTDSKYSAVALKLKAAATAAAKNPEMQPRRKNDFSDINTMRKRRRQWFSTDKLKKAAIGELQTTLETNDVGITWKQLFARTFVLGCVVCGDTDAALVPLLHCRMCWNCLRLKQHATITKTRAKKELKLKDADLCCLKAYKLKTKSIYLFADVCLLAKARHGEEFVNTATARISSYYLPSLSNFYGRYR